MYQTFTLSDQHSHGRTAMATPDSTTSTVKPCKRCGTPYPRTTEYYQPASSCKDGMRLVCRRCMTAKDKERYERCREDILEALRQDRQANPERYREIDRRRNQSPHRRALHVARTARRRSRLKQAKGSYTADDIKVQLKSQRGKCWWCGRKVGQKFHVDHLIPLARGGTNEPRNIVISCPTCNVTRRDKLPHEWNGRLL